MRLTALCGVLAACGDARSVRCGDGTFCPDRTACGGAGVCVVEVDACARFSDGAVCELDFERGRCAAGACVPGLELIGEATPLPNPQARAGIPVTVRGHPEIELAVTNDNGFFGLRNIQPHTTVVLELSIADALPATSRPIVFTDRGRAIDRELGPIPLIADSSLELISAAIGVARIPGTGSIAGSAFELDTGPFGGLTAAVTAACEGPLYLGADLVVVTGATATVANEGTFIFINCSPDAALLSATFPGRSCRTLDDLSALDFPIEIVADRLLWAGRFSCAP